MALVGHISGSTQSNSVIGISGSVIIANAPDATFPSLPGADVKFFVKDLAALGTSGLVSSGSVIVKGVGGSPSFSVDTTGAVVAASVVTTGNITVGGNIAADADEAKSIFSAVTTAGNAITIGGGGTVVAGGDLKVMGNDIQASDGNTNITMTSNTLTTFTGDVKIGGNDIQASDGTTAITLSGQNVLMPGSVTVSGDLTVNGTTVTADVATVTVEDPIIGLGFTSGSTAVTAGDRGWVGGLSGDVNGNVAMVWDNDFTEFAVGRTTATAAATTVTLTSYGGFHAGAIQGTVITASLGFSGSHTKLADGTSAFVAGSGITITSASNGAVTITSTSTTSPGGLDTYVQFNDGGSFGGDAGLTYNKTTDTLTGVTASFYQGLFTDSVSIFGNATLGNASNDVITVNGTTTFAGAGVTTTFQGSGSITGNLLVGGAATLNGNTTLGASSANTVTVNGTTTFAGITTTTTFAGSGSIAGALVVGGNATLNGNTTIGNASSDTLSVTATSTFAGATVTTTLQGSGSIAGDLTVGGLAAFNGNIDLGDAITDTITFTGRVDSNLLPLIDSTYNLGSATNRWANIFTGDLHLRNERGDYTLIEEEEFLSIRFNKTGKRYKFLLEPVPELDEELGKFSTGPKPEIKKKTTKKAKVKESSPTKSKSKKQSKKS